MKIRFFALFGIFVLSIFLMTSAFANTDGQTNEFQLAQLSQNITQPEEVRVNATYALQDFNGPNALIAIGRASRDNNPNLRLASIQAARYWSAQAKWDLIAPLLTDPLSDVQHAAAHELANEWALLSAVQQQWLQEQVHTVMEFEDSINGQLELAWFEQAMGNTQSALTRLKQIDAKKDYRVVLGIARMHADQGDLSLAIDTLQSATEMFPKQPHLFYQLALFNHQAGDTEASQLNLKTAYLLAPTNQQYRYTYGLSIKNQHPKQAIELFESTYRNSNNPTHLYAKCDVILSIGGDVNECLSELKQVAPLYIVNQLTDLYGVSL